MGEILKKNEIYSGNIVRHNGEKLLLIDNEGNETLTLIEEEIEYTDPNKETNPIIYGKQRWKVEVIEDSPFKSEYRHISHRYITFEIGKYKSHTEVRDKTVVSRRDISVDDDSIYPTSSSDGLVDSFIYGAPMCSEQEMLKYEKVERFVIQLYNNGEEMYVWNSVKEACEHHGLQKPNVYACLSGMRHSCGGFRWKWREVKNFKL